MALKARGGHFQTPVHLSIEVHLLQELEEIILYFYTFSLKLTTLLQLRCDCASTYRASLKESIFDLFYHGYFFKKRCYCWNLVQTAFSFNL